MDKAIFEFEKVVRRVFREEAGAVLTSVSDQTLLYYVPLPEVYESVCDFSFLKKDWENEMIKVDEFLQKVGKIKKWIENDFEIEKKWECVRKKGLPVSFEVSLNVSGMRGQIYRRNSNYLGIKVIKKRQGAKLFVLELDVDVGWVHYNKTLPESPESPYSAYERLLIDYFSSIGSKARRKRAFVRQTKIVEKGKKVFVDLISEISKLLGNARKEYGQYVEFLDQPITDYSQLSKPIIVGGGIKREEMFLRWKKELKEAFKGMFGDGYNYQVVTLPDGSDSKQKDAIGRMIKCTERVRELIKQADSRVRMHLGGKKVNVKTVKWLTISVPKFYSLGINNSVRVIPFTDSLKTTSGTEEFMKYLSGWEKFLEDLLLKTEVAKRQRKERKLML